MKKLKLLMPLIIILLACDKDEVSNEQITVVGTWILKSDQIFYNEELIDERLYDAIGITKISFSEQTEQYLTIDNREEFAVILYYHYETINGKLKLYPDSLIDGNLQIHHWNPENAWFGTSLWMGFPATDSIISLTSNKLKLHHKNDDLSRTHTILNLERVNYDSENLLSELTTYADKNKN